MVVYRSVEYSRRAGGFAGGYRRVVNECTGGCDSPCNLQLTIINSRLDHGKAGVLAQLAQSMFISGSATIPVFDGYSTSGISNTDDTDPGVGGLSYQSVAPICTDYPVSFQRWVVRRTQSQAVRADMLHTSLMLAMNGAIRWRWGCPGTAGIAPMLCLHWGSASIFLYSALRMGYEAVQSYIDRALPDEERQKLLIS